MPAWVEGGACGCTASVDGTGCAAATASFLTGVGFGVGFGIPRAFVGAVGMKKAWSVESNSNGQMAKTESTAKSKHVE